MSREAERVVADLRATLGRLHAELGRSPPVDAESRRLLEEVSTDIERVLRAPAAPAAVPASVTGGVHEPRLEALAVRFETQHPDVAASLRQLVDLLGRAGI